METTKGHQPSVNHRSIPWFGVRKIAHKLADEVQQLRAERDAARSYLEKLGALLVLKLQARRAELEHEIAEQTARISRGWSDGATALAALKKQIEDARRLIVVTEELALLQEVGVYRYRHPLSDSVAYKKQLDAIEDSIRAMTKKDGGAVLAATDWTVNGSAQRVEQWSEIFQS